LSVALWQRLIATAVRPPADPSRQVLVHELHSLAPINAGARARACLDVVLETCGLPAVNPPLNPVMLGGYVEELTGAIACVPVGQRTDVLRCLMLHVLEMLAADASRAGWDPAAEFLVTVLNRLPLAEPRDVTDVVADILDRPGCGALLRPLATRGGDQWERLVAGSDRLRLVVPWLLFEETALGHATSDELARCWAPIILAEHARNAPTRRPSLEALAGWSSRTQLNALLDLIELTRAQLAELGMPGSEADQWR